MWQIIQNALGSVLGAVIVAILGIGGPTVIISNISHSHNPRKKWRILKVVSFIALLIALGLPASHTATGGFSDFGAILTGLSVIAFVAGWIGDYVNK